jgi:hypothetical protein
MAYYNEDYKAYLVCIKDLTCDGDDYLSCIEGKTYRVERIMSDGYYVIHNEKNQPHHFHKDRNNESYYGNWFELELV